MKKLRLATTALLSVFSCVFFSQYVHAGSNISIANSNSTISFGNIKPSISGTMATATDELTITTDCAAGSNVYISAMNGSNTSLVNNAANSNNEIIALGGTTIGATALALQGDTWGFNIVDDGTYYGLPAYANSTDHAVYTGTDVTIPIYYGAKVTSSLTPGKYTGQVLYTATVSNSCLDYTLQFNTNGATSSTLENQTHGINDLVDLSTISSTSVIARDGYHLTGWKDQDNRSYGTTGTVDINPTDTTPVTLTAQWEANIYTIKYNSNAILDCSSTDHLTPEQGCKMADGNDWAYGNNGNTILWNTICTYNSSLSSTSGPHACNSGYCPSGYAIPDAGVFGNLMNKQGAGNLYSILGLSENRAFWTTNAYTSSYSYALCVNSNNAYVSGCDKSGYQYLLCYKSSSGPSASGSTADQIDQAYDTNIILRTNGYTSSNYDFLGWSLSPSATTASYNANTSYPVSTVVNAANAQNANGASITLYAVWRQKRTVTINSGTGIASTTGSGTYSVGQTVNISASPSSGYNFSSWTVNSGGASLTSTSSSSTSFTMPDANVTITANGVERICGQNGIAPGTTAATACKTSDNVRWVYGNNGNTILWNTICTYNSSGAHTCISSYCPAGYSVPGTGIFRNLINVQGSANIYKAFGLTETKAFWSTDTYTTSYAYALCVTSSSAYVDYCDKSGYQYLMCYKSAS